jgi:tRNA A-37 threonylcarbamoyl transferase component Bud32
MAVTTDTNTISGLRTLIEDRFYSYYPEFSSEYIHVKGSRLKKCHQSIIYQFDVHNTKELLKTLIVKKRVHNKYYNNHVIENTEKEFDILKHLGNMKDIAISAPRAVDAIFEEGILITEKIEGESLYSYLRRTSYLPITASRKEFLKSLFTKTGEWLRDFHNATFEGKKGSIDTAEFIKKAKQIVSKFPSMDLPLHLGEALISKMKQAEKDVSQYTCPIILKHGDFQPINIIFKNENISVVDIGARHKDLAIKDISNFITGLITARIKMQISFYTINTLDELAEEFLRAYYQDKPIPRQTIEFVKALGILEQLDNTYKRNETSFIKSKIITAFYNEEIRKLAKL